ncbi:hypothetical protein M422DRAFT_272136 [Sphaerobolus stellatus SS14]|uniref:Unplaced genomic scaffold SPHSTscaffold_282, whole genome shotgun sequence n=1 Tax=Sphaerobolus stellatus (strain SS14) TaxID=990650 RepID=A0A0C9UCC7_SPHS4|nr:hypothetical protein M422DRAFT_272136 [Sphaerobolus stellatus SS14]
MSSGVSGDFAIDLVSKYGLPVIVYDQIGNGKSTHVREKTGDGSFWTEELFCDELDITCSSTSGPKMVTAYLDSLGDTLTKHEEAETTDNKEYEEATQYFYDLHVIRLKPIPEEIQGTFASIPEDPTVYTTSPRPRRAAASRPSKILQLKKITTAAAKPMIVSAPKRKATVKASTVLVRGKVLETLSKNHGLQISALTTQASGVNKEKLRVEKLLR